MADLPFDQDADGVSHELVGHLQDFVRQCGADQHHLSGRGQVAVHVIDLLFKTWTEEAQREELRQRLVLHDYRLADLWPHLTRILTFIQHFVSLVQNQHLDGSGPQIPATDHVYTETTQNIALLLAALSTSCQTASCISISFFFFFFLQNKYNCYLQVFTSK